MHQKNYLQKILLLIYVLLQVNHLNAQVNTKTACDSLIQSGIRALNKNQQTLSLELLFQARTLAKKNAWDSREFLALNNIGTNYYRLSDYGEALNYYLEAYTIAIQKLTPYDEILVLNNIAVLYLEEKKYARAKDYFKMVYSSAKEKKQNRTAGAAALNLGTLAVATDNIDAAKTYYNDAMQLFEKPADIILAKGGLANCNLLQGHTKIARKSAQFLLENAKDLEYYHTGNELLGIIAKSYLKEGNPDMASVYIKKIFDHKPNPEAKIELFKLLAEINIKKEMLGAALQYKDSIFEATAKINEVKNEKLYENGKIRFELQNYKNQSVLNETKMANERRIFYYVLLFITIISLFFLWLLRNFLQKLRQKKLIAERNEQILALELEKEKAESLLLEKQFNETQVVSLLQEEKLKNEVELKNRKLLAKALYLSEKNQIIEAILSELSVNPQVSKEKTVIAHIKSLKSQLKADDEWSSFITHFEEVNRGFLNTLQTRHPALTINDIRYISYIYMGLSSKEIASMLHITIDSCRKRKERALSKLQLSKDTNLYEYLTSL